MTERQRKTMLKQIQDYYKRKRKAEKRDCKCYECKYFDEKNLRCMKRKKRTVNEQ